MTMTFILVVNRKGATGKTIVSKTLVNKLKSDMQTVAYLEGEGEMDEVVHKQPDYIVYDVPSGNSDALLISEPMFHKIIVPTSLNKYSLAMITNFVADIQAIKEANAQWNKEIIIALTQTNDTPVTSAIFDKMQEKLEGLDVHVIDLSIPINDEEKRNLEPALMEQSLLTRMGQERSQELTQLLELVK
ncbi:ParA family protein [Listeria grandensis]|uniref:ParA family protein n=1 Tax=Listeria grandensis TaxID=1494963 RepID=A0A7X0Y6D1_9LIST|nr:hypothetical protein [Listeria grandensis]MBC1937872.1 ParA family protein [Listeria grandensis]